MFDAIRLNQQMATVQNLQVSTPQSFAQYQPNIPTGQNMNAFFENNPTQMQTQNSYQGNAYTIFPPSFM